MTKSFVLNESPAVIVNVKFEYVGIVFLIFYGSFSLIKFILNYAGGKVSLVPDVPEYIAVSPDVAAVPELADVPEVPDVPVEPEVPLEPLVPEVPLEPEVPAVAAVPELPEVPAVAS